MTFTERQLKIIRFALWRFAQAAHEQANAAGQDKEGRFFQSGAVGAFLKDAADAEELLIMLNETSHGVQEVPRG